VEQARHGSNECSVRRISSGCVGSDIGVSINDTYSSARPDLRCNDISAKITGFGFVDVVAVNSVGSLKPELPPGALVSCSDYVCLQQGPQTFFDDELKGSAPGIDNNLMPMLLARLTPEFSISGGKT